MLKKILLVVFILMLVVIGACVYFFGSFMVNRSGADYQKRIEYIWPGQPPYQPTAAEKEKIETEKPLLAKFLQKLSALPDNKPYIVTYPLEQPLSPAVIVAPGGAYAGRAEKHEGLAIARWLNSIGVSAFVLNYRLERHPAPLSDAQRAIQYVRANAERFHIDPARVGMMGFSAGGHLAATAGTHFLPENLQAEDPVARFSSRPDFLVLAYPVISLGEVGLPFSTDLLVGPNPAPDLINDLSNEKQVTAETPPTFIWAAKTDNLVDYRNSQFFADALAKQGVPFEFHLFPEGAHGTGLAQDEKYAKAWPELYRQWMVKMGFLNTPL